MKARQPHAKKVFVFTYRGKADFVVEIEATSEGKAWREFRRHHVPHANKRQYSIKEGLEEVE